MDCFSHPLIRLVLPFTLGMVGANCLMDSLNLSVLFVLCCLALAPTLLHVKSKQPQSKKVFGMWATALAFLLGMTLFTSKHERISQGIPADSSFCQGTLTERPVEKAHSWALNLRQENGSHILLYIGKSRSTSPQTDSVQFASLHIGDTILAQIKYLTATNTCEDNTFAPYYDYLFHHDVTATAYCNAQPWDWKPSNLSFNPLSVAKELQERMHQIYDERGIKGEAGSIVEAMTIGRKTFLAQHTRKAFTEAGVSHVLALSGFHVGVIVMLMQVFFFSSILPRKWKWGVNLLLIFTLWGYTAITGLSPSLVRATTMFSILMLCQTGSGTFMSLDSCAFTFFIMLCINPFYLFDIGFQLSFLSVSGISLWSKSILESCPSSNTVIRMLWNIIFISLACTLFTTPLVAYHFGKAPIWSVVSNLAIIPFVYIIMWGSMLWWLSLGWTWGNGIILLLVEWAANLMSEIVHFISSSSLSTLEWKPGILLTTILYMCILFFTFFYTSRVKKAH